LEEAMITPELLGEFDLFKEVSTRTLKEVAAASEFVTIKKDDFVFHEGEKADKLHLLLHGSVALRVNLTSRPDAVTVSFLNRPYQILGWSGVVSPNHYTASALCEEDSELIAISSSRFMQILDNHPEDGYRVMLRIAAVIADRLRNSRQALLKTL
jgi:CRP/FNR family transcriptional activator FtrB